MKEFSTIYLNANLLVNLLLISKTSNKSTNYSALKNSKHNLTHANQQTGAALIMVLFVVLLLAIAGTIAIKSSKTSLDMTTSAQVDQVLFQSSDVPLAKLENVDSTTLESMEQLNGPIGYLGTKANEDSRFNNAEYVLCYQPTQRAQLYAGANEHRIVGNADGKTTYQSRDGYCQLDKADSYTSARKMVATQVAMTRPTLTATLDDDVDVRTVTIKATDNSNIQIKRRTHSSKPLQGIIGTDMGSLGGANEVTSNVYIRTYATSVLPALAMTTSVEDIDECMRLPIGALAQDSATTNQMNCLNTTDVPYSVHVQDYLYTKKAHIK